MSNGEVFGIPLEGGIEGQPVAALVIVKCFHPARNVISYQVRPTEGMTAVEALGMARYAQVRLEAELAGHGDP